MHLRDYVEQLKAKPEHIRRRVALGSSLGITGVVAISWVIALGASGTLALSAPAETGGTNGLAEVAGETSSRFGSLLGAVGAAGSYNEGGEPALTIVDGSASSTLEAQAPAPEERTVIPF